MAPELPDHIVPVRLREGEGGEARGGEGKETEAPACSPRPREASPSALAARTAGQTRSARGPPPAPSDWWTRPPRLGGAGRGRPPPGGPHPLLPPGGTSRAPKSEFKSADPDEYLSTSWQRVVQWRGAGGEREFGTWL